jgi:hypothetical protein
MASTKSPSGSTVSVSPHPTYPKFLAYPLTHQVKVNTVIHQIVLPGLHTARRTKVHPIRLACLLNLLVFARQANEVWVEFFQVLLEHLWVVARGVAGDHEREEHAAAFRNNFVVHEGQFVEFVGADIGAVREAEVDLRGFCQYAGSREEGGWWRTYKRVFA